MKIAYICGPYRVNKAKIRNTVRANIRFAESYAVKYWKLGYAVICPHLNTAFFDGEMPDKSYLDGDLEIISRLLPGKDCIIAIPGCEESSGAKQEIELARKKGIAVIYEKF